MTATWSALFPIRRAVSGFLPPRQFSGTWAKPIEAALRKDGPKRTETQRFITDRFDRFLFQVSQLQAAVRSGLVRKDDVTFPLNWYVEKRLCRHKKLLLDYIAEYSVVESKKFLESLDAWQRCSPG